MKKCVLLLFTIICSGCSVFFTPQKDTSISYSFRMPPVKETKSITKDFVVSVNIDNVPEYLTYPYIPKKVDNLEFNFSHEHRWAMNFKEMCQQLIISKMAEIAEMSDSEVLSKSLISSRKFLSQQKIKPKMTVAVTIDDLIFDASAQRVDLKCRWVLKSDSETQPLVFDYQTYHIADSQKYEDIVQATAQVLEDLSRDICEKMASIENR